MACGACNTAFGLEPTALVNNNPRALVFDNRASTTDLVDIPLPIRLDPSRVDYAEVADPSIDVRFHDPVSDADLPFEVEEWNPGGTSTLWVKVPRIPARTSDTRILMYYGELAHGMGQDPAALWRDYRLVNHGIPGSTYQSVPGGPVGVATGITPTAGQVAQAMQLGKTGDHRIVYTNSKSILNGLSRFTLELWLYADYASGNIAPYEPRFMSQYPPLTNGRIFGIPMEPQENYVDIQIDFQFATVTSTDPTFLPLQRWVHMAWRFDGDTLWTFRNGALANITALGTQPALMTATEDLVLGAPTSGGTTALEGAIDEVRLSTAIPPDDWIAAEYLAMNGGFITYTTPGDL
jgi:hypothetical protein